MSIFISLAAYREPELESTIKSALVNADKPDELVFGVFSQVGKGEHPDLSDYNVREKVVSYKRAKGPGYARSEAMKLYDGEEYFLQVDAHSIFTPSWDTRMKKRLLYLPWSQPIITGRALPYTYENGMVVLGKGEAAKYDTLFPHALYVGSYNGSWVARRRPMTQPHEFAEVGLGGLIFTYGDIVKDVPYDPRISWTGEEFLFFLRAYCAGYKAFTVDEAFIYHNYGRHNQVRVWDDHPEWEELQRKSLKVQADILTLKDKSKYRIKNKHRYLEYMNEVKKWDFAYRALQHVS